MNPNDFLLAFYGDDFTGSTDAMEILERAGIRTALFIEPVYRTARNRRFQPVSGHTRFWHRGNDARHGPSTNGENAASGI
jgi:hypothetical protein